MKSPNQAAKRARATPKHERLLATLARLRPQAKAKAQAIEDWAVEQQARRIRQLIQLGLRPPLIYVPEEPKPRPVVVVPEGEAPLTAGERRAVVAHHLEQGKEKARPLSEDGL